MTRTRRAHRILGLVLVLPLFGWALTGFVFFVKPSYEAAYGSLRVRTVPLEPAPLPTPRADWLELRALRTVLGDHLLVRRAEGWAQLEPGGEKPRDLPDDAAIRRLVDDAIAADRARYGEIAAVARHEGERASASIQTTTGAEIELDWNTLGLRQSGRDTKRINALYRIHYLQWTGFGPLDRVLGVLGLASLVVLAVLGARLAFGGRGPAGAPRRGDRAAGERP